MFELKDIHISKNILNNIAENGGPRAFRKKCIQIYPESELFLPLGNWMDMYLSSLKATKYELDDEIINLANGIAYAIESIRPPHQKKKNADWDDIFHCQFCWRFTPARKGMHICTHHLARDRETQKYNKEYKLAKNLKKSFDLALAKLSENKWDIQVPDDNQLDAWLTKNLPHVLPYANQLSPVTNNLELLIHTIDEEWDSGQARYNLHQLIINDRTQSHSILFRCEAWLNAREERTKNWGGKRR